MIALLTNMLIISSIFVNAKPTAGQSSQDETLRDSCRRLVNESSHCEITYSGWQMLYDCLFSHDFRFATVRLASIHQELDCPAKLGVCPSALAVVPAPDASSATRKPPPERRPPGYPSGPGRASGRSAEGRLDADDIPDALKFKKEFNASDPNAPTQEEANNLGLIIGLSVSIGGTLICCVICCCILPLCDSKKKKKKADDAGDQGSADEAGEEPEE